MKKIIILTLFIATLFLLVGCSKDDISYKKIDFNSIKIDETDPDYLCIKNASFFAESGVGYAGEIPEQIYAFGRLIKKENALEFFYKLEIEAKNESKLYALCALYYLDYKNFSSLMERYSSTEETVSYMTGCELLENYPIRELIKSNDESVIRLKNAEDTIDKWCERNSTHSYTVDFYGGAIPNMVMVNSSK